MNKFCVNESINFFDGWSGATSASTWWGTSTGSTIGCTREATRHTSWSTTCSLVHLSNDWVANLFNFFLFVFIFLFLSKLVSIKPLDGFIASFENLVAIFLRNLVLEFVVFNS